ncbi:MAG TPA: hypothetical protein DEP05_09320 [Betaproteobacteria bacterium]|nr:hypothetical protein [Betaproteobacteria bacterium]
MPVIVEIHQRDCRAVSPPAPDDSFHSMIVSPPGGPHRSRADGGIGPEESVAWLLPCAGEFPSVPAPVSRVRETRPAFATIAAK